MRWRDQQYSQLSTVLPTKSAEIEQPTQYRLTKASKNVGRWDDSWRHFDENTHHTIVNFGQKLVHCLRDIQRIYSAPSQYCWRTSILPQYYLNIIDWLIFPWLWTEFLLLTFLVWISDYERREPCSPEPWRGNSTRAVEGNSTNETQSDIFGQRVSLPQKSRILLKPTWLLALLRVLLLLLLLLRKSPHQQTIQTT